MNTAETPLEWSDLDVRLREWLNRNWNDRLMDMVSDGVYVINLEGEIFRCNCTFREVWGSLHGQWQSNLFSNRMLPEDHFSAKMSHQNMTNGSRGERTLRRFLCDDNINRHFDVNESPIRSGDRLWGIIGVVREWNPEEKAELSPLYFQSEERERLEHALRSSLGLIRGYAFALDRYPDLDRDKQHRFVGYIREEANRLSRWLDNALETPHHEREVLSCIERVSLAEIIQSTTQHIVEYASRRGITVEQHIPNTLPEILASREAIVRIMDDVLDNAVSLSPPEGLITVAAHDTDQEIAVAVTDVTPGMGEDPTDSYDGIPLAYEDQFLGTSRDKQTQGIGLGLAVAKRLTESMGGKIGVTSSAGKGTTFTVTFPKQAAQIAQLKRPFSGQVVSEPAGKPLQWPTTWQS